MPWMTTSTTTPAILKAAARPGWCGSGILTPTGWLKSWLPWTERDLKRWPAGPARCQDATARQRLRAPVWRWRHDAQAPGHQPHAPHRSEERRVGREWRARGGMAGVRGKERQRVERRQRMKV